VTFAKLEMYRKDFYHKGVLALLAAGNKVEPRPVVLPAVPASDLPEIDPRLPRALAGLSSQQRAAVLLVHAHGWTLAETADALGCGVSTVRNHLDRGMRRLRASLGDDDA